jgi:DNA-binding CsgD family transcriptional regulator
MLAAKGPLLDVIEASREAVTLNELAEHALRGLQTAFGCGLGCFTRSTEGGSIEILSCTDANALREYHRDWFENDPINDAVRRYDASWLIPATRLPEWPTMRKHPLYAEWAPSKNVRFLLHLRLSEARYLQSGAVNAFLCRSKHEPDFGHRELLALSQVMPDLETAVQRCGRVAAMSADGPFLESLLDDAEGRARLALRGDGRVMWASKAARRMLADHLGPRRSLPALLAEKAQSFAEGATISSEVHFATARGKRLTASLQKASASTGEAFVVVRLRSPAGTLPEELRERFCLTVAEADVLSGLADGLSDAQIARRRAVAISTVRTHVTHVLSKMGLRSRLQAGVLARGAM